MSKSNNNKKKLLFLMSGSIACFKACDLISSLMKKNYDIKVAVTPSVYQFIGKATLEGLTGNQVIDDTFIDGAMMDHINLERWADKIILAPASANTINKMASGVCDNIVTTLFMAHAFNKDFLIVPAMNTKMYEHPLTQKNLKVLKEMGLNVMPTSSGHLACGEIGSGRMLEPTQIVDFINSPIKTTKPLNILVSAGGTSEPIDGVRSITNSSTGKTGVTIAHDLFKKGHNVTLLKAKNAVSLLKIKTFNFSSAASLDELLNKQLANNHYDLVIHLAAVSDFTVEKIILDNNEFSPSEDIKISSNQKVELKLKKTKKIISSIREYSKNKNIKLVGFKLTNTNKKDEKENAVKKLFSESSPDLIVHNDVLEIKANNHLFNLYQKNKKISETQNISTLNDQIVKLLQESV